MPESHRLLSPEQEEAVRRVRSALDDLRAALARLPAAPDDEQTLRTSAVQLDELFLLVVVGEFNAGKSALINALLGGRVVAEGVTPTTSEIQVLRHRAQEGDGDGGIRTVLADAELLRDLHLVDTPGTNAILRHHEALTQRFVPRADLILFVTSADRPFTESEHQFLERIREWGKKVVIVINKADLLQTDADREAVRTFVRDNVHALLGFAPDLFAVSARAALQAKERSDAPALAASGFGELEGYVRTKLDDRERFRLKLLNPLGVGLRLCERYAAVIGERLEVLRADVATVEQIRTQIAGFRQEMTRGFQLRLADVDNLLHQFEKRGHDFFDETVRAARIFDLLNRKRIQADFEEHVVRDLPRDIEARVERLIDWLVSSDLQQWQEVRNRLASRKSEQSERVAGRLAGGFEYDRGRLLDTVGKAAQQTLDAHDHRAEAKRLAESAQMAVANAALLEAGAVGLGTLVSLLATTTAADVTGIVAAGLLATVGFFVIPRRRQNAKKELGRRVSQLREQLMGGLSSQFARETERSVQRVEEAIAPYVQFVEGERLALAQRQEELAALDARLRGLRTNV